MQNAELSVIVPVRNEEMYIRGTLRQLLNQQIAPGRFEILVVDGQSTDRTAEIVRELIASEGDARIKLLSNPKKLSSAARNIGVRAATADIVLLVDGHVYLPSATLIADILDAMNATGADVIGRPQRLSPPGISRFQQLVAAARASRLGHAADSHVYSDTEGWVDPSSVAVAYRKSVFDRVGFFDESFDAAEDLEFNTRLARIGAKCYFSPRFEVLYFPRGSAKALFRQMRRYGVGRARLVRKTGEWPDVYGLAPALAVFTGGLLVALVPMSLLARVSLSALALVYASVVAVTRLKDHALTTFPYLAVLTVMSTIHVGLGVGFIGGLVARKPPSA